MVNRFAKNVLVITVVLGLMACAQQMNRRADGGMTGTGSPLVTIGTVTKFGSVIVNGIEWNSDNARVVVNGKPATTKGLRLGMIVRVEGTREVDGSLRGVANSIQYESDLVGPMNAASMQRDGVTKFSVAGQPIYADATTVLEGFAHIAALDDGDQLEISGYRDRYYALHATWIRKNTVGSDVVRVKGLVSNVSERSFNVEGLTVRYPKELDLRASLIKEGTFVAISAKRDATNPMLVTATSLTPIAVAVALPEDTPVIMEGLIKGVTAAGFTMHNRPIKLGDTTTFERGSAADLREDTKVHVIGRFKSGTFAATKVIIAARVQ
jgi:Domain of unknown function (DUF5666)